MPWEGGGMSNITWRDYDIRIWHGHDDWVDVDCYGKLDYARSNQGHGMQTLADEGSPEWERVLELCDAVRDAMLELDGYLEGLPR